MYHSLREIKLIIYTGKIKKIQVSKEAIFLFRNVEITL